MEGSQGTLHVLPFEGVKAGMCLEPLVLGRTEGEFGRLVKSVCYVSRGKSKAAT